MSPPILEVVVKAAGYLKEKGVPNARLDAELLFAHVLGMKRLDLYLQFDRPLTDTELERYRAFIRRRGQREPLQHIVGITEFRELNLKTDRRALIPRPETEILLDCFKRRFPQCEQPRILDMGTGTGAIALSVLKEFPQCEVTASDISQDCLNLTRENAELNQLPIPELVLGNLFESFLESRQWDVILSNPPYIAEPVINTLEPEVKDFDPLSALSGGKHGYELPAKLLKDMILHLAPGGFTLIEIDPVQFEFLEDFANQIGFKNVEGLPDYENSNRFLVGFR